MTTFAWATPRADPPRRGGRRAAPASPAARLLALQRTAGNAAARRVLARDDRTITKPPNLDSLLKDAVAKEDWPAATAILLRYASDAERRTAFGRLSGYAGMRIAEFIRSPAGAPYRWLEPVVRSVLEPWMDRELPNHVKARHWSMAAYMLHFYADSVVLSRLRDVQRLGGATALGEIGWWAALAFDADSALNRSLAFLDVESVATMSESGVPVDSTTPEGKPVTVAGGSVTTFRDVSLLKPGRGSRLDSQSGSFGFEYTGADALKTGWLQFIALEAETFDSAGKHLGWVTSVRTQFEGKKEKFRWGTDKSPIWYLDTSGGNAPFYGAESTADVAGRSAGTSGSHISSKTQATIFDRPTVDPKVVNEAFDDDDVAKLVVRLRFHDYLVRDIDVLYENTMTVEFPIAGPHADPNAGRTNRPGTGRATSTLAAEHYKALVHAFPKWGFYAHR